MIKQNTINLQDYEETTQQRHFLFEVGQKYLKSKTGYELFNHLQNAGPQWLIGAFIFNQKLYISQSCQIQLESRETTQQIILPQKVLSQQIISINVNYKKEQQIKNLGNSTAYQGKIDKVAEVDSKLRKNINELYEQLKEKESFKKKRIRKMLQNIKKRKQKKQKQPEVK